MLKGPRERNTNYRSREFISAKTPKVKPDQNEIASLKLNRCDHQSLAMNMVKIYHDLYQVPEFGGRFG